MLIITICGRPVVALIQVEIQKVDVHEQRKVHESVMQSMGPADPTIVVSCDDDEDDEGIDVGELLEVLDACGTAVLVRYITLFTYQFDIMVVVV